MEQIKTEALIILMEECGELIQSCSKIIRTNNSSVYRKQLQDEIGDVLTLIEWVKKHGFVTDEQIKIRMVEKKEKLKQWSRLYGE